MHQTHYLVAGASHAGLQAVHAIRQVDPETSITVLSRDSRPPYSPTILPYVVSGHSDPEQVVLRAERYFEQEGIDLVTGAEVVHVDDASQVVTVSDGDQWHFEKLLLATGADPLVPPIKGLGDVDYHALRTMDDALRLRDMARRAKRAVVLGAGLIGMHGAENLCHAGLDVTVVEQYPQVLPGYFDAPAAGLIEAAFSSHGITMIMGHEVVAASASGGGCVITLDDGRRLEADLLLVATGVRPRLDYLRDTALETEVGVLVDDHMRSNIANIWAAGDVAQARDFFSDRRVLTGILPDAVEQGHTAGMDMAEDVAAGTYAGGVPINTYTFFGQQAISVGRNTVADGEEVCTLADEAAHRYRKILLKDGRLRGISCINEEMDAGIMWQLILREVDLDPVREAFVAEPLATGRALMSSLWR